MNSKEQHLGGVSCPRTGGGGYVRLSPVGNRGQPHSGGYPWTAGQARQYYFVFFFNHPQPMTNTVP